ncbi:hypothetical protein BDP81DRAFT_422021 [Colletotrichum phormii]|uniref:Uncharacterized protein n=1 Tax=Colletotrichum phormii TaxID=359342 RepID=A0AAI9ZXB0_9PEZI|nr:uncharacterized protein BDP81DRAFT_422021 [Colletotrichum phormii]KAK1639898.1 hypothetical protein BDP81DRAFT_422021 [Colletotrichum phormii]
MFFFVLGPAVGSVSSHRIFSSAPFPSFFSSSLFATDTRDRRSVGGGGIFVPGRGRDPIHLTHGPHPYHGKVPYLAT